MKGIEQKPDSDVSTLSEFDEDARRSSAVVYERHSSIHYMKGGQSISNVKNRKNVKNDSNRVVIQKLKLSVTFRDNILYYFSYLLHGQWSDQENGLTDEQYTSLHTLYEFLKKKMVYVYNLLSIIPEIRPLDITDKSQQTFIILLSLAKNLPTYLQCTAEYLAKEIELDRINLNTVEKPALRKFNFLANIDLNTISKGKIKNEEMVGYDNSQNITQRVLGPVFVKLLHNLQTKKQPLSQELFGLILINLPNPNDDPVLEENIRFLYDLTKNNAIDHKSWNLIRKDAVGKDVYNLVFSVLTKCLKSNVQMSIKDAAVYVYHHLKPVTTSTYVNSNLMYIYDLTEEDENFDLNIELLFSPITPQDFDLDTVHMKNNLLTYFRHNNKNEDINKIIRGFNKFAYSDSFDLLLALLTRLTNRIPSLSNINADILQQSATTLLSALIVKKYNRAFSPFVSREIDILTLLESLRTPDANPELLSTIDSIKLELIAQPQVSMQVSTLIPTEKSRCLTPKQCLTNAFQQVQKLQNKIPLTLTTKIQNVVYILKTTSQNFPMLPQYSIKPVDVNLYLNQEKPIAVAIETDKTYTNNMITDSNRISHVWDIDKYDSKISSTIQNGLHEGTIEVGVPTYFDYSDYSEEKVHEEKGLHPTTTDVAHVIKKEIKRVEITDESSEESSTDWSLTSKPLPVTPKPRRKRPQHPTEIGVGGYSSKIEYTREHGPESIFHEKHKLHQSGVKDSAEVHISPPKRKISTKVTTHTKSKFSQKERMEQKISSETVSRAVVLPPNIDTHQPLQVQSINGVIVVTSGYDNTTETEIVLPEVKDLLKPASISGLMRNTNSPIVIQVLKPLSVIFGKNFVTKILKNVDVKRFPTNILLLLKIFEKAVTYPEVTKNSHLTNIIYDYISGIKYVSSTVLLPIVASSKKLVSNVVYSTFNPNDLTYSIIDEHPPDELSSGSVTMPLVNPKQLLESVNPFNPYADLLPTLKEGDELEIKIRPLKAIFRSSKIVEILGPDFQPLAYPSKGALLITLLQKLYESKIIQSNSKLKYLIEMYIQALEVSSTTVQVSEDNLVKMMSETTGQWQPELTSLISALPTAKNNAEVTMLEALEKFLADLTLLGKLHIKKPLLTMTRGNLLQQIFSRAGTIRLEKRVQKAIKYYKDKIEFTEMGALPIMWMWVEMYVFKAEIQLGNMIQETVDFNQLSYKEKLAYNDLITYLAQNPNLLEDNEDFNVEKFETRGEFVTGIFDYLLDKPEVNNKIKRNIKIIRPHVKHTGAGAIAMPNFSKFKD